MPHKAQAKPNEVVSRDPEVHSGDLVFAGTRVPVDSLIDALKAGQSIDDFLEGKQIDETARRRILETYSGTGHKRSLAAAPQAG